jgi:hypothetical protein
VDTIQQAAPTTIKDSSSKPLTTSTIALRSVILTTSLGKETVPAGNTLESPTVLDLVTAI